MKISSSNLRQILVLLPFLALYLFFRFNEFFHSHPALLLSLSFIFLAFLWLLARIVSGKPKILILGLWITLCSLLFIDFLQHSFYNNFSKESLLRKIGESNAEIEKRTKSLLRSLQAQSNQLEQEVRDLGSLRPEALFLHLKEDLAETNNWWAIYDEDGKLIRWSGQVPFQETFLSPGMQEVSVFSALHRQFLKYKKAIMIGPDLVILVVLNPISADYGIQNRYLNRYNLLTDGLSLRPDLLYNSQQSSAVSPDLIIRTIQITPDFSISALYRQQQYADLLENRVFYLHWWLEFIVLLFSLVATIDFFFEFLGVSGREEDWKALTFLWLALAGISLLSVITIGYYTALSSSTFFNPHLVKLTGLSSFFRSPGSLFLTAFFLLNAVFTMVLFVKKIQPKLPWRQPFVNYICLLASLLLSWILLGGYYNFVKNALDVYPSDPMDLAILRTGATKVAQIFGMAWLDFAFILMMEVLTAVSMANVPRDRRHLLLLLLMQAIVPTTFYLLLSNKVSLPFRPLLLVYFGVGILVFYLPVLWRRFEKLNLLSRFFAVLLFLSFASFLFHFTRFHYAGDQQRSFLQEAAFRVTNQEVWINEVLQASQERLDEAIPNLSVDPRIPDQAYRLWIRTDLATHGLKSALEIYDDRGRIVNRFALGLPRLSVAPEITTGDQWERRQRLVTVGNDRKPVLIASRVLPEIGYLVLQVVQDYSNLPFFPPTSPFQELFRPQIDSRLYVGSLYLNVYDGWWRPLFLTSPELSPPTQPARDLLKKSDSTWIRHRWNDRDFQAYYFKVGSGFASLLIPAVSMRSHLVHLIDLCLFNLFWLALFTLVLVGFFRPYLALHFHSHTPTRFNFFQKLMLAFVVFSMIPIFLLSLLIRNYVWEKKIQELSSRTVNSFSVVTKVVYDYLLSRASEQNVSTREYIFSNDLLEWVGQVIQQDVTFYYDRYLLAASNREIYSAGLLGEQIPDRTYADLFLRGQKYSRTEMQIGSLKFLNVSGRIFTGRYKDEVISIPFLIDEKAVEAEIFELREYMMLTAAGLFLFAVLLGYFLASRFSRPVQVLMRGTGEMSRGNLKYRIRETYRDEFQQLMDSFNSMAGSLDAQQDTLERRRAYIENILNHITTAVISIDNTTNVTTINPAAVEMLCLDPTFHGEIEKLPAGCPEWSEVRQIIRVFLKDRSKFQMKEISLFRTGEETNLRLVYVPLFEEGNWNGAVLLVEDISDIIRSNRLSAWAEMARRVAHEVKNPLTPIQLAVEHLVRVYQDNSQDFEEVLKSCSEAVLKQVKTLRKLVSDFSHYGRPAGLNRTEVQVREFLEELVASYRPHLPEGIVLESRWASTLPVVRMDVEKMRGAFMNIVENGLQAMNGRGKITVEAEHEENGFVKIRITDTGQGVPEEVLPKLFEPYFSTRTGGTGLGLAIARKNIEDHGGKIQVESRLKEGTSVTVWLPVSVTQPTVAGKQ